MSKKTKRTPLTEVQRKALAYIDASPMPFVLGVDEVGVGSWAGPVTVAAVVIKKGWSHDSVRDSKDLTRAERSNALAQTIFNVCEVCCELSAPAECIDREGIEVVRRRLTMGCILYCLRRRPNAIIVQDGTNPVVVEGYEYHSVHLPKADALVAAVSAASILAKVTRDNFMQSQEPKYPGYGFASNVGYHSLKHVTGLSTLGSCAIHRRSYKPVQKYLR